MNLNTGGLAVQIKKIGICRESIFFAATACLCLLGAALSYFFGPRAQFSYSELSYATAHLPKALLSSAIWIAVLGFLHHAALRSKRRFQLDLKNCVAALVAIYCVYWLPVFFAGGFVHDDWYLLAAASIRTVVLHHPTYSLHALEAVEGNFRPLSEVLYFSWMLRLFGVSPTAFMTASFLVNLSATVALFFLTREFGYSLRVACVAAMLYLSRGLTYTLNIWAAAVGDGMVLLFCGVAAVFILKANRRKGLPVLPWHFAAWLLFLLALLTKQSAFAFPPIAAALVLFPPGQPHAAAGNRRTGTALAVALLYTVPTICIFLYANTLQRGAAPIPVALTLRGIVHLLSFPAWYLNSVQFSSTRLALVLMPEAVGFLIIAALGILIVRVPEIVTARRRDLAFFAFAAFCSMAMFAFAHELNMAYYSAMFAFWASIGAAICLTNFGAWRIDNRPARICCFLFFFLLSSGFVDIQLKLTGLIPSGGYIRGVMGSDQEALGYRQFSTMFADAPQVDSIVLLNVPYPREPNDYAVMALLADEKLSGIFIYHPETNSYTSNDLHGQRPLNDLEALNDPREYIWNTPVSADELRARLSCVHTLWIRFDHDSVHTVPCDIPVLPTADAAEQGN
jgi:hypothetical protein